MLPDVDKFMDEQPLQVQPAIAEIVTKKLVFWMKPKMTVGRHGYPLWLKPPPFAVVDADFSVIECITEHGLRQGALANGQRPTGWMRAEHALARHPIVILNLFQDNEPSLLVILKQVQDDEMAGHSHA
jgi:hypothetical protein